MGFTTLALLPWLVWLLVEGVVVWDPLQMLEMAWQRFLHLLPLMLMMAAAVYVVLRWVHRDEATVDFSDEGSAEGGVKGQRLRISIRVSRRKWQ